MKPRHVMTFFGLLALLGSLAGAFAQKSQPPGMAALQRRPVVLTWARPGPITSPRFQTIGGAPGAWVVRVQWDDAQHSLVVDRPSAEQLALFREVVPESPATALVHGDHIWQLENQSGAVLVDYASRAAEAGARPTGPGVQTGFLLVGLGLLAGSYLLGRRERQPGGPARGR